MQFLQKMLHDDGVIVFPVPFQYDLKASGSQCITMLWYVLLSIWCELDYVFTYFGCFYTFDFDKLTFNFPLWVLMTQLRPMMLMWLF